MPNAAKAHEAIVARYLWVRNLITTGHGRKIEDSPYPYESIEPEKALEAIREAVIFEIPLDLFAGIYRAADIYTCTQIAGLEWTYDPDENPNPPESIRKDMPHYWKSITDAGRHAPYATKFPFSSVWFGLEPALPLKENQRTFYNCHQWEHATLAGILATAEGNVWSVVVVANTSLTTDAHGNLETASKWGINLHMMQERSGTDGIWHGPLTLSPWVVPALLEWVNDHKVVSVEQVPRTLGYRRMVERAAKRRKIRMRVPPPYYAVTMRDVLIEDIEKAASNCWPRHKLQREYQHQWQVTGHDRIRVKRGPLPLDDKTRAKLLKSRKRGARYQIFEDGHPSSELAKELWRRGVKPKREDEWMAVLVSRITDYVKGPADKPLIPSTRRSGRNRPFTP